MALKYVFVGDDDVTSHSTLIRKAIVKENTFAPITRLVHAGDGPYKGEGKTWSEKTKLEYGPELMKVFRMVRGNHDCKNSEKPQTQIDIGEAFGFPTEGNWLWAEQVENSYIIGMDSEDLDIEFERDQKKFVAEHIAKAKALRAAGTIDWIIVVVHKPWFTLKSTASPYTAVRRIYNDMFLDAQVDFMFYGHNHNWQGWFPMEVDFTQEANGLGKQLFELMPDGKTFNFAKRHGWQGTVTGSGGHEWNPIDDGGEGVKNVMKYFDDGLFKYTCLEIDGKFAKLMAKDSANVVAFEAHFSREGGTVPPPECTDPAKCIDSATGICRPIQPNEHKSPTNGLCMSNTPNPHECPPNQYFNEELQKCIPKLIPDDGPPPPPPPPPPISNNYKFSFKFGSKGNGDGQFVDPHDTTFDSEDNIYIPDRERNDIQVFTHDGKFIRKFGGPGKGPGQFNVPYSCQIGPGDTVWVCDRENSRVQKLSKDGTFIQEWKEMNGKKLNMPEDLAFDVAKQFLYFTDTGNHRVIKCTADMQFVLEWGSKGDGDDQFDHPHGIDVGPDHNVYVNSGFQPYIKKFTADGKFIKKWGSEGTGEGQFLMFLEHLDVDDRTGNVFIINNNVRPYVFVFDSEGKYLSKFGSEKEGSKDGEFKEPEHVTIDSNRNAYCVDSGNFRIQVFKPEGTVPPPPPPGNKPPIADAGLDQTIVPSSLVTLNGSKSYDPDPDGGVLTFRWKEVDRTTVALSSPNAINPTFTAPATDTVLAFQLEVIDAKGGIGTDVVSIIVKSGIIPPPPPPPPPGDVLWDSDIHLKTGQAYTIEDTYGDQSPDGKGVFMAASGNPRLHVDPDGTFHLEADGGHGRVYIKARNYNSMMTGELMFEDNAIRNTTLRLRSRHGESGACENRFGGFGVTVEREEQLAETSTERCHNEHSNTKKNALEKHIEVGAWIKFKYSCWSSADKKAINQKLEYDYGDGQFKTVVEETFTSVEPHMMDEAKMAEESYAWLRINNEQTGKVAYRHIKIIKI